MGLWRQHSALHFVFCFGMFPFTVTSECVTGLIFSFTAFWSLLHRQHSLDQLPFFIHVDFSLVSIFPDISLLCFWPVYWLFRLYVHDASNEIHVSIRDFIYPDVLFVVACCFWLLPAVFVVTLCRTVFVFLPTPAYYCCLWAIVWLGIYQFLLNCTRSTSIGYNAHQDTPPSHRDHDISSAYKQSDMFV